MWVHIIMDIKIIDAQVYENTSRITEGYSKIDFQGYASLLSESMDIHNSYHLLCDLIDEMARCITPNSACMKGCSHCCYQPVFLSPIEVSMISGYKNIPRLNKPILNDPKSLLATQKKYIGVKCPFLEDNVCSVYPVRPLTCRLHFNLSNTPEICESASTVPMLNYRFLMPLLSIVFRTARFDIHQYSDI